MFLGFALSASLAVVLAGCTEATTPSGSVAVAAALPEAESADAEVGSPVPPGGAIVFDLKYHPQTGGKDDLSYNSFWGYGGSTEEALNSPFLKSIPVAKSRLRYEHAAPFKGREWAAVEYDGRQALALYFDLNANGKFDGNERFLPVRKEPNKTEFITSDFVNQDSGMFCRVLLQVNFYNDPVPTCMWSPAAVMDGTSSMGGKPARLLLYAGHPGGTFDEYGSSRYALRMGRATAISAGEYVPRETLSTLIVCDGEFYRLKMEGRRSNGLPAQAVLVKDTTPRGQLMVSLQGAEPLESTLTSISLLGAEDKKVCFRVSGSKSNYTLPTGSYAMNGGQIAYRTPGSAEWGVSFSGGPRAEIAPGQLQRVSFGRPVLHVRAVEEAGRYSRNAKESDTYKKGERIYLEPRVVGRNLETYSRFSQKLGTKGENCPPKVTITDVGGKQILSKTMEYG
jgi:hypothetical protein